jgi:hypothetical protein
MHLESWVLELILTIFFFIMLWETRVVLGRERTSIFLWGSIIWTGIIENVMVMLGAYDYYAYANYYSFGGKLIEGYPGFVLYVAFVPLCICLGWFLLSMPALIFSMRLFGEKRSIWLKAGFAAAILVCFDMLLDPISVVNEWWRWTSPSFYLRGVPIGNYIGWFFLLFFFGAIYERTVLQLGGFRLLNLIEKPIFRMNTLDLTGIDYPKLARIFYFRVIVFLPIFYITCMIVATFVVVNFCNNWGPFDSVFPAASLSRQMMQVPIP